MDWSLFPYQQDAVDKVFSAFDQGSKSPIVVIPTGGGKTQTYLAVTKRALDQNVAKRVMILAHRKGLVEEPVQRLLKFFPELSRQVGIVMAERNQPGADVLAVSRDTVAKRGPTGDLTKLNQILKYGPIDLLVTDECHNADNESNERVRAALREANPNLLHVGVTATPRDRQGHLWDSNPVNISLPWMINNNYLARPMWFPVHVPVNLASLRVTKNEYGQKDYAAKDLAEVMETDNWCDLIVRTHLNEADRSGPSMAFTVSVSGSKKLADAFNAAGVKAMHVDGEFDPRSRAEVMAAILSGKCEVVCNCSLWTEGTDIPPIRNLHMARPTRSYILYTQMLGRGLRRFGDKQYCRTFEYAYYDTTYSDNEEDQQAWIGKILGLPVSRKAVVKEKNGKLTGFVYEEEGAVYLSGDPAELVTKQIDRIKSSGLSWIGQRDEWLLLAAGKGDDGFDRTYLIPPPSSTEMFLLVHIVRPDGRVVVMEADDTRGMAYDELLSLAEGRARKFGQPWALDRSSDWRNAPVTEGQLKFAFVKPEMTRGQADELIKRRVVAQNVARKGYQISL